MMAVIIAGLMSDLDSIFNSASSLFTIDIWKRMRKHCSVREQMIVGRWVQMIVDRYLENRVVRGQDLKTRSLYLAGDIYLKALT